MLWVVLASPGTAFADSCGTAVTVVNHRSYPITVTMKSFYMDRELPAPAPDDFDTPIITREVPAYFSRLIDVEIAAGQSTSIPFRRLCTGDFWLNWRELPTDRKPGSSGQLRQPSYNMSIHIGE
ncbi:hypothetical protein [Pseudoxanthomonas sp. 3HH-4]|uniref:hypothetical protein n=1 Tax=Pseudoxanthomonas sp. 3HH-4 TaxID=1690214 RepID=UPI001C8A1BED|nr:hypothetical protein [Pseudoxanthomonas sp. 3HH-4]